MSMRVDTSPLISGSLVVGDTGHGVLGSEVPSTGDNGAGYLYNDLSLPADASKEVRGEITAWPSAGTLFAYEDSSFEFTGAPDGSYSFTYQLYVDGVATGSPQVSTIDVGSAVPFSETALQGAVTVSGQSLDLSAGFESTSSTGNITVTGLVGTLIAGASFDEVALQGSITVTGQAPTIARGFNAPSAQGSVTVTGNTPVLTAGFIAPALQGDIVITGLVGSLITGSSIPFSDVALQGSISVTGQTPSITLGYDGTALQGGISLTGQAPDLACGQSLTALAGDVDIYGQVGTFSLSVATVALASRSVNMRHSSRPRQTNSRRP